MTPTKSNKIFKIVILFASILLFVALVATATSLIISRVFPEKNTQISNSGAIKHTAAAKKIYKEATEADRLQDFDKAISQYNEVLPFYKNAAKTSVNDQNTVWQIEARIDAIKQEQINLQKKLDDQAKQNPDVRLVPEDQSRTPENSTTDY